MFSASLSFFGSFRSAFYRNRHTTTFKVGLTLSLLVLIFCHPARAADSNQPLWGDLKPGSFLVGFPVESFELTGDASIVKAGVRRRHHQAAMKHAATSTNPRNSLSEGPNVILRGNQFNSSHRKDRAPPKLTERHPLGAHWRCFQHQKQRANVLVDCGAKWN